MAEEQQENTLLTADYIAEVEEEEGKTLDLEINQIENLSGLITSRFKKAEDSRKHEEGRWISAYHNYRGLYGKQIRFRESEKSRVFVKITKTKVIAAFGQLVDVIFGTGKFPIGVQNTNVPEGALAEAHLDINNPIPGIETTPENTELQGINGNEVSDEIDSPFDIGYEGDGRTLKAGATFNSNKFIDKLVEDNLEAGYSPIPEIPELNPAQESSRRMEKLIHDQIDESNGSSELRNAGFLSFFSSIGSSPTFTIVPKIPPFVTILSPFRRLSTIL